MSRHTLLPKLDNNLSAYVAKIHAFPMLDRDEEYQLAKNWRDNKDVNALNKLVKSHLKLVARIARGYSGYGLPIEDLISEGNVGILQAVKKFDPNKGARFSTYAMWWIKSSMQEYILHSWSLVKLGTTKAQKKLFFSLSKIKSSLGLSHINISSNEEASKIAEKLDVPTKSVIEFEKRLSSSDFSANQSIGDEGGEWQDWIIDETQNQELTILQKQELNYRQNLLSESLKKLTDSERQIIIERRLSETSVSLEEIAKKLGVSRELVRQKEISAFAKLQKFMKRK